jgi:hypothetical protein
MPTNLPYLPSYKNVGKLFEKIATAKTPDAFTHSFLRQTLGLKSTADRALIPLVRALGFIDAAGKPTGAYGSLKNASKARGAIAHAVRSAYGPLFDANEQAHKLSQEELKGLVGQVAGTDADMTAKIVGTLNSLLKVADFQNAPEDGGDEIQEGEPDLVEKQKETKEQKPSIPLNQLSGLRPEFHFNIQVHLPANATEEAYLSIFTALRKAFQ